MMNIRVAAPEDASELVKIYAPYVTDTAVTFEYEVPGVEEFESRIRGERGSKYGACAYIGPHGRTVTRQIKTAALPAAACERSSL